MASPFNSRVLILLLLCFPELLLSAVVTLHSLQIYNTHEWMPSEPTVYFHCKGENKSVLPDVKKKNTIYSFKGEESWQPLTEFLSRKCKRCGFYEEDQIMSDDVFGEWEFCPSEFAAPSGVYIRAKANEFNATFLCPDCIALVKQDTTSDESAARQGHDNHRTLVVITITAVVLSVSITGLVMLYKCWQRRKRQQEAARFLKLFEENDDIEDEFGDTV